MIDIGGHTYSLGKLDVMRQFHVARRLAPAVWALTRSAGSVLRSALPEGTSLSLTNITAALRNLEEGALMGIVIESASPLVDVFAHMSDADSEYVITQCLSVCSRKVDDDGWQVLYVEGSGFVYQDMSLPEVLQLVVAAVKNNLGNFTDVLATPSP